MAERCKDCQWNGVCTEFARCILEPIPEDYGSVTSVDLRPRNAVGMLIYRQGDGSWATAPDFSTGGVLCTMLETEPAWSS